MILSSPLNALVPFAAEILKSHNAFDASRLFGVTTLDVARAEAFLAEEVGISLNTEGGVEVNVVGGHSAETMVPLFSQVDVARNLSREQLDELVCRELLMVLRSFPWLRLQISTHTGVGQQASNMVAGRYTTQRRKQDSQLCQLPMLRFGDPAFTFESWLNLGPAC